MSGNEDEAKTWFERGFEKYEDVHLTIQAVGWFEEGKRQSEEGHWEEAISSYDKALEFKPNYALAWNNRGYALNQLKRHEEAIASYDKALEFEPDDPVAWNNRGYALNQLKRHEEAIASYDKALEFEPDDPVAWNNRGYALNQLKRHEEAIASYDKALEFEPDDPVAWNNRGYALNQLKRHEEAIASYDKALEFEPDDPVVWYNRGSVLDELKRYEEAIASYDKALEIQPNYAVAWNNRGSALDELKRYEEAIASYDKALEFEPDDTVAWNNRGSILDDLKRYEEAIASFDKALEIQPDFAVAWNNRGSALDDLKRYEEAIASFDKALEIQPDFAVAWNNRGSALDDLKRYEEAIASYDKALEFEPNYADAWNNRGSALDDLKRYEEAIASFDKALEFEPDDPVAWYNRGSVLYELKRYEEAISSFEKALEFEPDDAFSWYNRGSVLYELKRYEEAISSFEKALEFEPDDAFSWYNRGSVLYELKRYEEAISSFEKALEIQPNYDVAWNNRGYVLNQLKRHEEAIASYDKALEFEPDYALAWNNRGNALNQLKRYEEAIASYNKALEIQPDFAVAWKNRGKTLRDSGYDRSEEFASYYEGLKHCRKDTHPEDYAELYQAIAEAHCYWGTQDILNIRSYWQNAVAAYEEALKALKPAHRFPKRYLEVLQLLSQTYFRLGEIEKGRLCLREGTDLVRRLVANPDLPQSTKNNLKNEFANFNQFSVDRLIQKGDKIGALEVAEESKNACLTWILEGWSDSIPRLTYPEIQQLLTPETAVVYWHISPAAITTFIIKRDIPEPIAIEVENGAIFSGDASGEISKTYRLQQFENWVTEWKAQYQDYCQSKLTENEAKKNHPWFVGMPDRLKRLGDILNIEAIIAKLDNIAQLVLIPHRDLHLFPVHALFGDRFTISYLPSAEIGRRSQQHSPNPEPPQHWRLLSVEPPHSETADGKLPYLPFAEVESELICQLFSNSQRFAAKEATQEAVETGLTDGCHIFHFTGHSGYNFEHPRKSGLALTGKERLEVQNIVKLNLSQCQLVYLSSCETGVTGNQAIATEYVGVVSAFLSRLVSRVVSTLWRVDSDASALVAIEFYRLRQHQSDIEALNQATRWLRDVTVVDLVQWYQARLDELPQEKGIMRYSLARKMKSLEKESAIDPNRKPYDHPYYWTSFIITGKINSD